MHLPNLRNGAELGSPFRIGVARLSHEERMANPQGSAIWRLAARGTRLSSPAARLPKLFLSHPSAGYFALFFQRLFVLVHGLFVGVVALVALATFVEFFDTIDRTV